MKLIRVKNGIASRGLLPDFLVGLQLESLADLSWTDPALGVSDCAWWPEDDQSPALAEYERYGAETLTIDAGRKVVTVLRAVEPWTVEEIAADQKARVPQSVPMLNAHLILIAYGWMPAVRAHLDALTGPEGEQARVYFDKALTMRRDNALVLSIPSAIGKTEAEVDQLFIAASNLDV